MANSTTNLDLISSSQALKEITANALFDASSMDTAFGRRASTTSALTWGYYGGNIKVDGTLTQIANGTLALTANTTNYIYRSRAGVVAFNTTGFPAGATPLYSVVTGAATISSYTDYRIPRQEIGRLSLSVAGGSNVTLTQVQSDNDIIEFTGAISANISVTLPLVIREYTIYNGTTGAYQLTIKGASGTGVILQQGVRASVYCDGTNFQAIIVSGIPSRTPASATDLGSAGDICADANYIYFCSAANTWKRVAIAAW